MKTNGSPVHQLVGDAAAEDFWVAGGHFGGKNSGVVKAYAEALGFEYLQASDKKSFDAVYRRFLTPEITDRPMLLEVFTDAREECKAFDLMGGIDVSVQSAIKKKARKILGPKRIDTIKKVIRSGNR